MRRLADDLEADLVPRIGQHYPKHSRGPGGSYDALVIPRRSMGPAYIHWLPEDLDIRNVRQWHRAAELGLTEIA